MKKPVEAATESGEPLRAYSPEFVARAVDYHVETIRDALRDGRLRGVKIGAHWRIPEPPRPTPIERQERAFRKRLRQLCEHGTSFFLNWLVIRKDSANPVREVGI